MTLMASRNGTPVGTNGAAVPENPTRNYLPRSSYLGAAQAFYFYGKPWFSYYYVPAMTRDPWICQLADLWTFPFQQVKTQIKARSVEVQAWVQKTFQKFWSRYVPIILDGYFHYGFAPGGFEYGVKRDSLTRQYRWQLDNVTRIIPLDARPHTFKGTTKFAGFECPGLGLKESPVVKRPYAFWFSGLSKLGIFYDRPPLAGAYDPWLEANGRGGAKDLRQLYMRKHSIRPAVCEHPGGQATFTDSSGMTYVGSNADIAQLILEYYEAGSNVSIAQERDQDGNKKWELIPAEAAPDAPSVREYPQDLKRDMAEGVGIPFEVLQAAEGGTGYSGREIPYLAWLGKADQLSGILIEDFSKTVRPVVRLNFGMQADFEITPLSLVEQAKKDSAAKGGGQTNGEGDSGRAPQPIGGQHDRDPQAVQYGQAPKTPQPKPRWFGMSGAIDPDVMQRVRHRARAARGEEIVELTVAT